MPQAIKSVPTSLELDSQVKHRVNQLAKTRHRSAHSVMIEAINQYLSREEQLEQFRDEMEDVWAEYQRTGLQATSQDVFSWMETWFTEDEQPKPTGYHQDN